MHTNVDLGRNIKCAVLTVSDTRNVETDKGGKLVLDFLNTLNTEAVSYTHLTLPTTSIECRSRWSPYH